MNTMIYYSINILLLSGLVLVVGMINPKWILLWMEKPERIPVAMIAAAIFMIGAILHGEGRKQEEKQKQTQSQTDSVPKAAEVPIPGNSEAKPAVQATPAQP